MRSKGSSPPGIRVRHQAGCPARAGGDCACLPTYEPWIWIRRDGKKVRRTFPTLSAARAWRRQALADAERGALRMPTRMTVREATERWLRDVDTGVVRTRAGESYKPSAVRSYRQSLDLHVLPELGRMRLADMARHDVQALVDRLHGRGLDPSSVRNAVTPVRALCRWAIRRGLIATNPTSDLDVPIARGRRERVVAPAQALALVNALAERDRALWGTAFFAGLRLGELRGLRWDDVDLDAGVIHVVRSWDAREGPIEPKSRAGRRDVPTAAPLRRLLVEHRLRTGAEGLVFGRAADVPFDPSTVNARAYRAWATAGLEATTMHEARHSYASYMIAAGVNLKAVSTYMGHSTISTTLDLYAHLLPGSDAEARTRLDALLTDERGVEMSKPRRRDSTELLSKG